MPYEEVKICDECKDSFSGGKNRCMECRMGYGPEENPEERFK